MTTEKKETTVAVTKKEQTVVDVVSKRISVLQSSGELHFPPDYSPQNALKSAWLILQTVQDKDKKPVLEVCTKPSIVNALLDMVITGLNPAKKQGYFIAYGKQLVFQRSYFGSEALAKRVDPNIKKIPAEVVYEGDKLEYEIRMGEKVIVRHSQNLENINPEKIVAAYAMVIGQNGEIMATDMMTFAEIKKSWEKSKVYPILKDGSIKEGTTHADFTADMCKRTVINRICKPIFNSSDDKYLKLSAMRSEVVRAEEDAEEEIDANANQEIIDIDLDEDNHVHQEGKEDPGWVKAAKEAEKSEPEPSAEKTPEPEKKASIKLNVRCPITKPPKDVSIEHCENECEKFKTCIVAHNALSKVKQEADKKPGF
jgi:recombination protein RecT